MPINWAFAVWIGYAHVLPLIQYLKIKKMEDISLLENVEVINEKTQRINVNADEISRKKSDSIPSIVDLMTEGSINFFNYLKSTGMSRETNLIILPSRNHFYYDSEDLKGVRILINLKKLNLIKHLDIFLKSLVRILPQGANFIGCFSDSNTLKRDGLSHYHPSRLYSRLINFLDSKTDNNMNENEVSELLERNGLETVNMKEMNGLTYFTCKVSHSLFN